MQEGTKAHVEEDPKLVRRLRHWAEEICHFSGDLGRSLLPSLRRYASPLSEVRAIAVGTHLLLRKRK